MNVVDERSWSLPDGFKRTDSDPDGFKKVERTARDKFAQSGVEFDGFLAAESNRQINEDMESEIENILRGADPVVKKLIGEE